MHPVFTVRVLQRLPVPAVILKVQRRCERRTRDPVARGIDIRFPFVRESTPTGRFTHVTKSSHAGMMVAHVAKRSHTTG